MLHYVPRHVLSSTMLIFRRSYCIITAYTRSIATLEISERSYTNKMRSAVKTIVNKIVTTSGVNPHELVKCGSENISLDIKFV